MVNMRGIRMLLLLVAMGPVWASPSLAQAGPRREAPQSPPHTGSWGKAAVMKEQARALTADSDE